MKGEASLVAEDVEGLAVGVLGGGGVVFALVEEGSGLLAFEGVVAELYAVHGEGGRGLLALTAGRRSAAGSDSSSRTRGSTRSMMEAGCKRLAESSESVSRTGSCVHRLGEDLQGQDVVVAVDDQAGKEIGFAEDDAVGVGVADERLAIGDGIGDALAKKAPGNPRRGRCEIMRMAICEELE